MTLRFLSTLVSAGLFALCFPDGPLPLAAFVCLVPLAVALDGVSARGGLMLGFLCGFWFWLIAAWWLANGFYLYVALSRPAAWMWTVTGCVAAALPYAIFAFLCGWFGWMGTPLGRFKAATVFTVLLSWYPLLFPGNHAHSLYAVPLVIQIVDLGGVPVLLLAVNVINFFIAGSLLDLVKHRNPVKSILAASAVLMVLVAYGGFRLHGYHHKMSSGDSRRLVKIVSIQPNFSPRRAGVPFIFGNKTKLNDFDTALALSETAIKRFPTAQAIVWPELPDGLPCDLRDDIWRKVGSLAEKSGIPFIVNCYTRDPFADGDYNIAQLVRADGKFGPGYKKQILLPFSEYLPGESRMPWLRCLFPSALRYIPGNDSQLPIPIGDGRKAVPAICYEVLFPGHVRSFIPQGGNVIINLVDDVWFGKSDASAIHMSLAVFRSVEFRVPLVRVTNSGNGVFVQPTGEIVEGSRTPSFRALISAHDLFVPRDRSVYATFGDMFLIALTVIGFGLVMLDGFLRIRFKLYTMIFGKKNRDANDDVCVEK